MATWFVEADLDSRLVMIAVLLTALSASGQTTQNKKAEEPATGKWLNSRITFTFGDDNVLLDEGESKRNSPTAYFGACNDSALDRTVENQCKGASNFTHLLIYRRLKLDKYFQPEAALSINLDLGHTRLADGGSYIKANYFMDDRHETLWAITLFPVDSDVMRLGFYRDISFGGSNTFPRNFRRRPRQGRLGAVAGGRHPGQPGRQHHQERGAHVLRWDVWRRL